MEALAKAKILSAEGRHSEARDYYVKAVDVTPQMAYQLIKVSPDLQGTMSSYARAQLLKMVSTTLPAPPSIAGSDSRIY